jgi:hypothetical protein
MLGEVSTVPTDHKSIPRKIHLKQIMYCDIIQTIEVEAAVRGETKKLQERAVGR